MARVPHNQWPEVVFVGDQSRAVLSQAAKDGRAFRLGPGIYTPLASAPPEETVRRNWAQILDHELPGAIITDRSARRSGPVDGILTVVHGRKRPLDLPGLTIMPRPGSPALPGDTPMLSVRLASRARAMLENLGGRSRDRYLSPAEVETWLADILVNEGRDNLLHVRDDAHRLAPLGGWTKEQRTLDAMIGAALSTRPAEVLSTEALRAHATGVPYDHHRLELFEVLVRVLIDTPPEPLPLFAQDTGRRLMLPFYEAYFSNYIEGTEFTLDEAAAIVFDDVVPSNRPQDAHDVLGTYRIVADEIEMARTPERADDLVRLLKARHRSLMEARPDKRPGQFKERANQAGSSLFVAPHLVEHTLRQGFDAGAGLIDPFARAVYLGFIVSEVHPFDDGNGRIARITMNGELSRASEARIIIPTIYRNNYLSAMKAATHNANFASLIATLRFAQRYTARIDFTSRVTAEADFARTNALRDANEADLAGVRLRMPS